METKINLLLLSDQAFRACCIVPDRSLGFHPDLQVLEGSRETWARSPRDAQSCNGPNACPLCTKPEVEEKVSQMLECKYKVAKLIKVI